MMGKKGVNLLFTIVIVFADLFFGFNQYFDEIRFMFWFVLIVGFVIFNERKKLWISNTVLLLYELLLFISYIAAHTLFYYETEFASLSIEPSDFFGICDFDLFIIQPLFITIITILVTKLIIRKKLKNNDIFK